VEKMADDFLEEKKWKTQERFKHKERELEIDF
jgi:hypothetical protein